MTAASVLAYVRASESGVTCADVAAQFRTTCAMAGAALRDLREAGKVKSRGRTRGTTYTAR